MMQGYLKVDKKTIFYHILQQDGCVALHVSVFL